MSGTVYAGVTNWKDFKAEVYARDMRPQWYEQKQEGKTSQYRIYATDGFFMFSFVLFDDGSADTLDFKNNYMNAWNEKLDFRDANGFQRTHSSPRPENTHTYFSGAGDANGIGDGDKLLFQMSDTDTENAKTIDLTFSEGVYIKDGYVITSDAPFGSFMTVEVVNTDGNTIGHFCKNVPLLGSFPITLNTEDSSYLPQGYLLRCSVSHSDIKQNFKVVGRIEMYRANTVA
jgi:hypothetical protein